MATLFLIIVITSYYREEPINWSETVFYAVGFPIIATFMRWLFDYLLDPEAGRK